MIWNWFHKIIAQVLTVKPKLQESNDIRLFSWVYRNCFEGIGERVAGGKPRAVWPQRRRRPLCPTS